MKAVSSVLFEDHSWETASQLSLGNCFEDVRSQYIYGFHEGAMCNQAQISVEGCCYSRGPDISDNDFKCFARYVKMQKIRFIKLSPPNI